MRSGYSSGCVDRYQNFTGCKCNLAIDKSSRLTIFSNSLKPALYCLTQASNKYNNQLPNIFIDFLTKHNKPNMGDLESESRFLVRFSRIQSSISQICVVVYIRSIPHS